MDMGCTEAAFVFKLISFKCPRTEAPTAPENGGQGHSRQWRQFVQLIIRLLSLSQTLQSSLEAVAKLVVSRLATSLVVPFVKISLAGGGQGGSSR